MLRAFPDAASMCAMLGVTRIAAWGPLAAGTRAGLGAGRIALRPAGAALDLASGLLGRGALAALERLLDSAHADRAVRLALESPLAERTTIAVAGGPLAETAARELVRREVAERLVETALAAGVAQQVADRMLAAGITEAVVVRALEDDALARALDAALVRAVEERAGDRAVERMLASEELRLLVDEVVRAAAVVEPVIVESITVLEAPEAAPSLSDDAGRRAGRRIWRRRAVVADTSAP